MKSVTLSFLIDNMDVYRDIANIEQQYKVRAIDTQLREIRRRTSFPWNLKKATLKIFKDVYEYPIAEDHGELAYIDKQNINNYADAARFHNTSLQQFYENVNETRNNLSDIWKDGQRMIGVNLRSENLSSVVVSEADDVSEYTQTGGDPVDAITLDEVDFISGSSSIKFTTTTENGVTIYNTFPVAFSDEEYRNKYYFVELYCSHVPGSVSIKLYSGTGQIYDSADLQFDGRELQVGWNVLAINLNDTNLDGAFDSDNIIGYDIYLQPITGNDEVTYHLGRTYLKTSFSLDYWYYSLYNVVSQGSTVADKEYFIEKTGSSADINLEDSLIGDTKWIDFVIYGAMRDLAAELENDKIKGRISEKFGDASSDFNDQYPNMTPLITTKRRNFNNEPGLAYQTYDKQ